MNKLQKLPPTLDSREVAEMVGKTHAHLCRDIAGYVSVISTNPNLDSLNFFVEQTYKDKKGETRKRYDITKKGCEMVANKLTGEKGILFTAEYVERFNQMEQADNIKQVKQIAQDKTKEMRAAAMLKNAETRQAKILLEIADASHIVAYKETLRAKAANMLAGETLLPMPKSGRERHPLGWYCEKIGKPYSWGSQLGKKLKRMGITKEPGQNGEFVEDHGRGNVGKQVQNFEWYVDYLMPIVQKDGFID